MEVVAGFFISAFRGQLHVHSVRHRASPKRVLLTTTTKMGRLQADSVPTVCWSVDVACAAAALDQTSPVMLVADGDDHKVTGPEPETIDTLFAQAEADFIVVEADGSRGLPLKAPAPYEPVIPSTSTLVVALVGVDAVGRPLGSVTHRPEVAHRFTGLGEDHILSTSDCARILSHPDGLLRATPRGARLVVAVTKANTKSDQARAADLCSQLEQQRPGLISIVLDPIS